MAECSNSACGSVRAHGGSADQLGATITAAGVNFAVYSESASAIWVSSDHSPGA